MPYKFKPGMLYRMPTHFGPSLGPRQGDDGRQFDNNGSPKTTSISISFLTNNEQLEELLPEGFSVNGEPVVTVTASYMKELEWLAGRGYNTLGVSWPAVFNGKQDHVSGGFLSVLWENLADPIITGREDLGFNKIYCELPEPAVLPGKVSCAASWLGFQFLEMKLEGMKQLSSAEIKAMAAKGGGGDGILHFKYMPRTGEWGKADAAYATLTPAATPNRVVTEVWRGSGKVQFHKATWEDLPTLFNIVNAFEGVEIKEYRGATMMKTVGGKDLRDQRILR
jgi:hypothetical protein